MRLNRFDLKTFIGILSILVLLPSFICAEEASVNNFGGLSNDPSIMIDPTKAQDLLNVSLEGVPPNRYLRKRYGTENYTTTTLPASWDVQYDGDVFANVSTPTWSRSAGDQTWEEIIDGKYHVTPTFPDYKYYNYNISFSTTVGYTFEFRVKVDYQGAPAGQLIKWQDGVHQDYLILSEDKIHLQFGGGEYEMDTTDDYHTYRLVREAASTTLTVYVDNISRITDTITQADTGTDHMGFGGFVNANGSCDVYWDYVYISTSGAYVPHYFNDIVYSAHVFDNASNQYFLIESSQTTTYAGDYHSIFSTTDGAGTWTEVLTGLNPSYTTSYANYVFGTNILCWGGNGNDSEWYSDGTTLARNSSAPKGSITASWLGRIWKAGITSNPSSVRWSDLTNGAHSDSGWTSTQGLTVGTSDPTEFTALIPDGSRLLGVKEQSVHAIYNVGGDTFKWTTISDRYGCIDKGSVQEFQNGYVWLSKLGFLFFDGSTFTLISEDIEPEVKAIKQFYSYSNAKSWYMDKTENFTASGSSESYIDTGDDKIKLDIGDWTEDSDDFSAGANSHTVIANSLLTADQVDTATPSKLDNIAHKRLTFGYNDSDRLVDGNLVYAINYLDTSNQYIIIDGNKRIGVVLDEALKINKITVKYKTADLGSTTLKLQYKDSTNDTWTNVTGGTMVSSTTVTTLTATFTSLSNVTHVAVNCTKFAGTTPVLHLYELKVYEAGYYTDGYFTSQILDSEYTLPTWDKLIGFTDGLESWITYYTRVSTYSTGGWDDYVQIGADGQIKSDSKQCLQWKAAFYSTGVSATKLSKVTINYIRGQNIGWYYTPKQDLGTDVADLGLFNAEMVLNSQTIDFYVQTSSYLATPSTSAWVSAVPGYKPANQAVRYAWWKALLTTSDATQTPELFSVTLNYFTGETVPKQGASATYDNKYYYSGNSKKNTYNDTVFVWDRFGEWVIYDWRVGAFGVYLDDLYYGDSNTNYVYRAEVENLYSDDGAAYKSYWKSKDLFFGSLIKLKEYERLFLTHDYGDGYITLRYTQDIDGTMIEEQIDKDDQAESKQFNVTELKFESGEKSYFINFEFSNEDTNPFKIYNLDLYYETSDIEERVTYD